MSGFTITQPKLLLVEGDDEDNFLSALKDDLDLEDLQIQKVGGKTRFRGRLKACLQAPKHEILTSIGIVRDADNNPAGAFDSICGALEAVGLPVPPAPLQSVGDDPRVTVMILPGQGREGMLEDLCLASVTDDPAMTCVESYFDCLEEHLAPESLPGNPAKARVRAFLSAMEWIEEGYFESIQTHLQSQPPRNPVAAKVHALLAARYKPNLDLGIAARKGYWPFDHPAFAELKQFLQKL